MSAFDPKRTSSSDFDGPSFYDAEVLIAMSAGDRLNVSQQPGHGSMLGGLSAEFSDECCNKYAATVTSVSWGNQSSEWSISWIC
jgi:hypothetical protein